MNSHPQSPLSVDSQNPLYEVILRNSKKQFNCLAPGCGKTFKFKSDMTRHLVIHSATRPFVCEFPNCGKSFKRADALSNHQRLHSTETPFHCPVPKCFQQFNTKAGLQYHLLKHNEEKLFTCELSGCGKSFITYAQLKQHEKSSLTHKKLKLNNGSYSPLYSETEVCHHEMTSTSDEMIFAEEEESEKGCCPVSFDNFELNQSSYAPQFSFEDACYCLLDQRAEMERGFSSTFSAKNFLDGSGFDQFCSSSNFSCVDSIELPKLGECPDVDQFFGFSSDVKRNFSQNF